MKQKKLLNNNVVIYQSKTGAIELRGDVQKDTIWVTQAQIADIFNVERLVVTKHISNIFKNCEVSEKSNVQKLHIANSDKPIKFYSLDIILAVGYRANSAKAIIFRQWASTILRQYITKGYAINKHRIANNYEQFLKALDNITVLTLLIAESDPKNKQRMVRLVLQLLKK